MMNVDRQPYAIASHAMIGGDSAPPTAAPVLKIPIPSARSRTGNHSPTALAAPGQLPASPKPSTARQIQKPLALRTAACQSAAVDQITIEQVKPSRVPITSKTRPETIWLMA